MALLTYAAMTHPGSSQLCGGWTKGHRYATEIPDSQHRRSCSINNGRYVVLGCPVLLGCLGLLSLCESHLHSVHGHAKIALCPLTLLSTMSSQRRYAAQHKHNVVWSIDATVKSLSVGALEDACHGVLPIVLALLSLFTSQLQVHYMCLREDAYVRRRNLCIGTLHPKIYVRAMLFGLLVLCPTIAHGGRTPATEGFVTLTLGSSGTGSGIPVPGAQFPAPASAGAATGIPEVSTRLPVPPPPPESTRGMQSARIFPPRLTKPTRTDVNVLFSSYVSGHTTSTVDGR